MPTERSSQPFAKLSDEARDRVLSELKTSIESGELRPRSGDPGHAIGRQVLDDLAVDGPATFSDDDPADEEVDPGAAHVVEAIRHLEKRAAAGKLPFDDLMAETIGILRNHGAEALADGAERAGVALRARHEKAVLEAIRGHIRDKAPGRG